MSKLVRPSQKLLIFMKKHKNDCKVQSIINFFPDTINIIDKTSLFSTEIKQDSIDMKTEKV